jgi:hypothetical protein
LLRRLSGEEGDPSSTTDASFQGVTELALLIIQYLKMLKL